MKVRIDAKRLGDAYPDTTVVVAGRKLHAPLIERILELPFDIYDGALLSLSLPNMLASLLMDYCSFSCVVLFGGADYQPGRCCW